MMREIEKRLVYLNKRVMEIDASVTLAKVKGDSHRKEQLMRLLEKADGKLDGFLEALDMMGFSVQFAADGLSVSVAKEAFHEI